MYTEKQIKGYAKALRKALAARNLELSHAQSLELIAETLGEKSWNHLSAKMAKRRPRLRVIRSQRGGFQQERIIEIVIMSRWKKTKAKKRFSYNA